MTRPILVAAIATLTALAGCGSSSGGNMVGACGSPVNGCSAFDDLTATTATIDFGGGLGLVYSPKCAEVKVGQQVTFSGDFTTHPLSQTCGPVDAIPHTTSGSTLTFTFTTAGTYGYQCDVHHAAGMNGAIEVVP